MVFRIGTPISRKRRNLLIRTYDDQLAAVRYQASRRAGINGGTPLTFRLCICQDLPDWIITIIIFGLFLLLNRVDGFRRSFDLNDTSLQHTHVEHERISPLKLYLISALAPAFIILLTSLLYSRSFLDLNVGWLGLLLSIAVTNTATDIIKLCVGRPRPDLLDRCRPREGSVNPPFGLSTWEICTETEDLPSGFRSFPSGHSSLAWAGLFYLTLYLSGKMKIYDSKGMSLKTWILLVPLSGAALVAISRTMDYRHHATDVIAGSILGALLSWYCYRQYYPELSNPRCDRPYSPRVPTEQSSDGEGGEEEEMSLTSETRRTANELRSIGRRGELAEDGRGGAALDVRATS